jgi:hypothetical protein
LRAQERTTVEEGSMLTQIQARLTYANVMATIAAFLALGGGAVYAADKIGGSDIRSNAIKDRHVAKNSIGKSEIEEDAALPVSTTVREKDLTLAPNQEGVGISPCNAGEVAVGGGWQLQTGQASSTEIDSDGPRVSGGGSIGWEVVLKNTSTQTNTYAVQAVCVPAASG